MELANTQEKLRTAVDVLAGGGSLTDRLTGAGVTLAAFLAAEDFPAGGLQQQYNRIIAGMARGGELPATVSAMDEDEAQRWAGEIVKLFGDVIEAAAKCAPRQMTATESDRLRRQADRVAKAGRIESMKRAADKRGKTAPAWKAPDTPKAFKGMR